MAKVNHAQIQNDLDTINGRATPVVDENFNREFIHSITGNERSAKLDQLFDRISPNVDAVVNGRTITAEQMNRSVDNLTNAIFGQDLPLKEFEFIVDDMNSSFFNSFFWYQVGPNTESKKELSITGFSPRFNLLL